MTAEPDTTQSRWLSSSEEGEKRVLSTEAQSAPEGGIIWAVPFLPAPWGTPFAGAPSG